MTAKNKGIEFLVPKEAENNCLKRLNDLYVTVSEMTEEDRFFLTH